MEKIKTSTGKEFDSDYVAVIPFPAQAYIRVLNSSLASVATVFSNPEEIVLLQVGQTKLENYTHLVALVPEGDAVKVVLAKE